MVAPKRTSVDLEDKLRTSLDTRHHWSSASQSYTPVTVLLQYLAEDWCLPPCVYAETYWPGGGRHIVVYHIDLFRDQQTLTVRVKANPVVRRLLRQYPCQVVPLRE